MGHTKSMFVQKKSNKDEQWNWLIITYNNDIALLLEQQYEHFFVGKKLVFIQQE